MRRRLDLAASLVAAPPVLFLDEPTTGLDPESRNELWALLRELVGEGTTLLLTTQYLEEADRLADGVVLLDHGRIVATGSPGRAEGAPRRRTDRRHPPRRRPLDPAAAGARKPSPAAAPTSTASRPLVTAAAEPATRLIEVVRALDERGVEASDVHRREATLDDVFLSLTRSPRRDRGGAAA